MFPTLSSLCHTDWMKAPPLPQPTHRTYWCIYIHTYLLSPTTIFAYKMYTSYTLIQKISHCQSLNSASVKHVNEQMNSRHKRT